jgi:membrane-bound lytic murein transglycosylase B
MIFSVEIEKNSKFSWNHKRPLTSQSNLEGGKNWWHHNTWLQNILQRYSNQNSMVLA